MTEWKEITCILDRKKGRDIVRRLHEEKNVRVAHVAGGRGSGRRGAAWQEVDIFTAVVEAERADEIFEFIHEMADIGRPGEGILYQAGCAKGTDFVLPDVAEEEDS